MKKLQNKLLMNLLPLIIIPTIIIAGASIAICSKQTHGNFSSRLSDSVKGAELEIEDIKKNLFLYAQTIAAEEDFIRSIRLGYRNNILMRLIHFNNLLSIDTLRVINSNGIVLAEARNPAKYGQNDSYKNMLAKALNGKVVEGIDKTDLGISLETFYPITTEDGLICILELSLLLDYQFLNRIKTKYGLEVVVYDGNRIQATTFKNQEIINDTDLEILTHEVVKSRNNIIKKMNLGNLNYFVIGNPILSGDEVKGVLLLALSAEGVTRNLALFKKYILGVFFVIILISFYISQQTSKRIVKPIITLTKITQEISKGKLEKRVDVASQDEIGALAICFNKMTADLKTMMEKDVKHREHLEQIIFERSKALMESEEQFRGLVDQSPLSISIMSTDGRIIRVNDAYAELWGIGHLDLPRFYEKYNILEDDKIKALGIMPLVERAFSGETVFLPEVGCDKKGTKKTINFPEITEDERFIQSRLYPLKDKNGEAMSVILIEEDITESKLIKQKLRLEKELSSSLVENTGTLFVAITPNGRVLKMNRTMLNLLGYSDKEVIDKDYLTNFVQERDRKDLETIFNRISSSHEHTVNENHIVSKNGKEYLIEWHGSPVLNSNNDVEYFFGIGVDITERRRAEEILRKNEEKYRILTENVSDVIFTLDLDLNYTYVIPAVTRLRGFSVDEVIKQGIQGTLAPASLEYATKILTEEITLEETLSQDPKRSRKLELEMNCKDGSTVWTEVTLSFVRDQDKKAIGILGVSHDITDRKQVERDLLESEERLRIFYNAAFEGIAITKQGKFLDINNRFADIFGYEREEVIGSEVINWVDEEDRDTVLENILSGYDKPYEIRTVHKDGSKIFVEVKGQTAQFYGSTVRVTVVHDITERRQAEAELKKSEEKFRNIFDNAFDGIFLVEKRSKKIVDCNKKACEMLRYSHEEIKKSSIMDIHPYEDLPEMLDLFEKHAERELNMSMSLPTKRKDGSVFYADISTSRMKIDEVDILLAFFRDITDMKAMEDEKTKLEIQLIQSQRMESIGTLAGGIAHDFNNILSPIMIHAEMAMMDILPDNPVQHNLKEIFKAGERARDLVKQILTFSRDEGGKRAVIRITPVFKELLKLIRSTIPATIDIQQKLEAESDTVFADATQMNQVLLNLCTNAAHAMREKGGTLRVSLVQEDLDPETAEQYHGLDPGSYLRLTVNDTGHGIDDKTMQRIFEPYFTTKKTGEGTGLGLAVTHGIVKSYNGDIVVESEVGEGTSFNVYFPRVEKEILAPSEVSAQLPKGTERILFVDDEKGTVDAIQSMLENLGYYLTTRTSSIEALEVFRSKPNEFDLIITDMTMPNMTGKDLAKEMMSIRYDIPIILCTGFSEKIDENEAKAMGISAYVMKPIIMRELANNIREVLDNK